MRRSSVTVTVVVGVTSSVHNLGHYRWVYLTAVVGGNTIASSLMLMSVWLKVSVVLLTGYLLPRTSKAARLVSCCASSLRASRILCGSLPLRNDMVGQVCVAMFARPGAGVPGTSTPECFPRILMGKYGLAAPDRGTAVHPPSRLELLLTVDHMVGFRITYVICSFLNPARAKLRISHCAHSTIPCSP